MTVRPKRPVEALPRRAASLNRFYAPWQASYGWGRPHQQSEVR